jgi:hypothetical protein
LFVVCNQLRETNIIQGMNKSFGCSELLGQIDRAGGRAERHPRRGCDAGARDQFGDDPDVDDVYDHVTTLMQETLDALASERRLPIIG